MSDETWTETHRLTLERFCAVSNHPIDVSIRAALAEIARLQRERGESRNLTPSYICAICYHEKDLCSHCDKSGAP